MSFRNNAITTSSIPLSALAAGLDEGGDPFHKRLSNKLVFAPAVEIDKASDLTARDHWQQIEAVGEANSHDREEDLFERGGLHEAGGIVTAQEFLKLGPVFNSKPGTH
jgi:hypothetical protein